MIRIVRVKNFRPAGRYLEFLLDVEGEERDLIFSFKPTAAWAIINDICDAVGIARPMPGATTPPNFFNMPMQAEIDGNHLKRFIGKQNA